MKKTGLKVWYIRHSQVFNEKEWNSIKMFKFAMRIFVPAMMFFGCNLSCINLSECVSMSNQECKVRPEIVNVNSDEPVFYPFSIKTSKCSGSCNNINDPYAKLCVPDVVKNMNIKVFNLIWRTNERRHVKWHETCKCKCRLDANVFNSKRHWNNDKCKGICNKEFIWNPSNCECECDNLCDVGEYLDYTNCKCRKRLADKLVEEFSKIINEIKIGKIISIHSAEWNSVKDENKCTSSCTIYFVLIAVVFTICKGIVTYKKLFLNMIMSIKLQIININGKYPKK